MFEIFKSYQFNQEKAHAYDFLESSGVWTYSCQILQGDFVMVVSITADNGVFRSLTGKRATSILKSIWKA